MHFIAEALINLSSQTLRDGLQFTETNSFAGIDERLEVLNNLGMVLQSRKDYFGSGLQRPGNLMGKLISCVFICIIPNFIIFLLEKKI